MKSIIENENWNVKSYKLMQDKNAFLIIKQFNPFWSVFHIIPIWYFELKNLLLQKIYFTNNLYKNWYYVRTSKYWIIFLLSLKFSKLIFWTECTLKVKPVCCRMSYIVCHMSYRERHILALQRYIKIIDFKITKILYFYFFLYINII